MRQMTWRVVDLIANLVSCQCYQFLYSNKHIILSTVLTRPQII